MALGVAVSSAGVIDQNPRADDRVAGGSASRWKDGAQGLLLASLGVTLPLSSASASMIPVDLPQRAGISDGRVAQREQSWVRAFPLRRAHPGGNPQAPGAFTRQVRGKWRVSWVESTAAAPGKL